MPYYDAELTVPAVNISVENHEMHIKLLVARDCYLPSGEGTHSISTSTRLGTFQLSSNKNSFTVVGCDTYAYFTNQENSRLSTGCMSLCSSIDDVTNGSCLGVGCCRTSSLPKKMWNYNISLSSLNSYNSVHEFNPCGFAFVVENDYFSFSTASLKNITEKRMPVVLDWAVGNQTCEEAKINTASYMCKENTNCTDVDPDYGKGYRCHCNDGYQGNPYLSGPYGCQGELNRTWCRFLVRSVEPADPIRF
ncbi:hypothetical protein CRG98_029044 [Punica granatum]|uniref:Uncharacterized protein n=1 Tax=Punica granatum TaxID=22663 RepID=A0A2I0J2S8_PUNGR|nr:hypothetical protein CRG98_029044 [Punica granatum]